MAAKPVPDTDGNTIVPQQTDNGPKPDDGDQSVVPQDAIPLMDGDEA
jgi:hypothetical protein